MSNGVKAKRPPTVRALTRLQARSVFEAYFAQSGDHRAAAHAAGVSERTGRRWRAELAARTKLAKPDGRPIQELTSFVGRSRELAALAALLDAGKRLITVLGPPGIGKTRLTLQAARRRLQGGSDVVFCDLRATGSAEDLCTELGRALGVPRSGSRDLTSRVDGLGRLLAARGPCLVVLDNFDPLAEAAASIVAQWIREAPSARFVVTSRRVLHVHGEHLFELGPLSLDEGRDSGENEAERLFVERARAVEPGFVSNGPDAHVRVLVRRLEGIPLAIELGAAQMRRASPAELLSELDAQLLGLSNPTGGHEPRDVTLQAAIDRSWRLLRPFERGALAQITAFRRGFSTAAAERVVDLSEYPEAPPTDRVLACLREASLVQGASEGSATHRRWDLFEAIREYAAQHLPRSEVDPLRTRHAFYFLEQGERWVARLKTREGASARLDLAREHHNLQTAFDWLARLADGRADAASIDPAIRMALVLFEAVRRWMPELAIRPVTRALAWAALDGDIPVETRVRLHLARSIAYRETDDNRLAATDLTAAAKLAESATRLAAEVDCEAAVFDLERGHHADARTKLERALTLAERCSARHLEGRIRRYLARALAEAFLDPAAFAHHAKATALLEAEGDLCEATLARKSWCVHRIFFQRGDASAELREQLERAREFSEHLDEGKGLTVLGIHHQEHGHLDNARHCYEQALDLGRRTGSRHNVAYATMRLGNCLDEEGRLQEALLTYARAAEIFRGLGDQRNQGLCYLFQAGILAREEDTEGATRTLSAARELFQSSSTTGFEDLCDLQRAQIELAHGRRATRAGASGAAKAFRAEATRRIEIAKAPVRGEARAPIRLPIAQTSPEARLLLRLLGEKRSVTIWRNGSAFQVATQPIVRLPRGRVIRRVLAVLAERRSAAPGDAVSAQEILRRCWPGERMHPEAGAHRVRQAVHRIRRAGLHDTLLSSGEGYLLDPCTPVALATEPEASTAECDTM